MSVLMAVDWMNNRSRVRWKGASLLSLKDSKSHRRNTGEGLCSRVRLGSSRGPGPVSAIGVSGEIKAAETQTALACGDARFQAVSQARGGQPRALVTGWGKPKTPGRAPVSASKPQEHKREALGGELGPPSQQPLLAHLPISHPPTPLH
jgi:hypothetical protein